MTGLRVAAVQASYVLMDRDATIGRVAELTAAAAREGAQLVMFPEVFVPGTAVWIDTTTGPTSSVSASTRHPDPRSSRHRLII
ncbi:MAG TPA: nitrilase-related carbon-nitrogen hydrolase [Streptosporangiaceae bacterium]|nr:nitrilase-related carbon-nitrogen hydrolase [Streptosporangiaceae bacterium]